MREVFAPKTSIDTVIIRKMSTISGSCKNFALSCVVVPYLFASEISAVEKHNQLYCDTDT
jgi:hypothetical protein